MENRDEKTVGRPRFMNDEKMALAEKYVSGGYREIGNLVPSIAGMACYLGCCRDTLQQEAKHNVTFSVIYKNCLTMQEQLLITGTLGGEFNAPFAKLLMTKHGYSDKVDATIANPSGETFKTSIDASGLSDSTIAELMAARVASNQSD